MTFEYNDRELREKSIGFDNNKYLRIQSERIKERIGRFNGKLYLEFGGKLFDDFHASRVLPGFRPDSKLRMLLQLKDEAEVLMVISAEDIERNKKRGDLNIGYDDDVIRLIETYRANGLRVDSVVITRYADSCAIEKFIKRLEKHNTKAYRHYEIEGYPDNVAFIMSEQGFGQNEFVETTMPLVIVTAPGPGSGKMAVCLSQLYHENMHGIKAGYAKFETFPVWNLPLDHPVNIAYEAATADLNDVNMIDPFHLAYYGETTVNYNRDIEIFPVLNATFENIYNKSPYNSPTDMGVNMVGNCIIDDDICCEASRQEIIRRYFKACENMVRETGNEKEYYKLDFLMKKAGVVPEDRAVVSACRRRSREENESAAAIELLDGTIVTGGSTKLFGALSAALLNTLKLLAGIPGEIKVISPDAIEPIQKLKVEYLGSRNPALHTDETLIALSMSAATDRYAKLAMEQLPKLRGCQAHTSEILSRVDVNEAGKLGIQLTSEPVAYKSGAVCPESE